MSKLFRLIWFCSSVAFASEVTECGVTDSTGRDTCDQTTLLQVDLNVKQDRDALQDTQAAAVGEIDGKAKKEADADQVGRWRINARSLTSTYLLSEEDHSSYSVAVEQSEDIDRQLGLAAESSSDETTKALFNQFRVCGQCSTFKRFGEKNDGGYLMCMDGLRKGSMSAAYSLGVEHHDKWSDDVVKAFGLAVNQFDCTVNKSSCQGCKFYKKCIVSSDGKHPLEGHESEGWSLKQALEHTGQANAFEGSLLMKMDIEGSEWPIFAEGSSETSKIVEKELLQKFGEIIVEFHALSDEARHAKYLRAVKNIAAAGFKIAHLHGNNNEGMYESPDYNGRVLKIPNVLEVTFVHSAARPGGCARDQEYSRLDAPNRAKHAELPMARLSFA